MIDAPAKLIFALAICVAMTGCVGAERADQGNSFSIRPNAAPAKNFAPEPRSDRDREALNSERLEGIGGAGVRRAVTIPAGSSRIFAVEAGHGQRLIVDVTSKSLAISLRKGAADAIGDFGALSAELHESGEFVFEVRNPTRRPIKTTVSVRIEEIGRE